MRSLDIFTLLFMTAFISVGMSVIMFSVQRSFESEVQGVQYWGWAQLTVLLALPFLALRGNVAELIVVPGYNGALLLGLVFTVIGVQLFYRQRPNWRLVLGIWGVAMLGLLWWLEVSRNFAARIAVFSAAELCLHVVQLGLVWRHGERHFSTYFFAALLLAQSLLALLRGGAALILGAASANLLNDTALATAYLATSTLLVQLLGVAFLVLASRQLKRALERRAGQDPLTGVLNRRGCAQYYQSLKRHGRHSDAPLVLLAIDLDHFKSVNDRHGHAMGDRVLIHVAEQVRAMLRAPDRVARFGGEEFVVLLPGTSLAEAGAVAARIQHALRETAGELPRCTVSIGIAAQAGDEDDFDELLARADRALYRAKERGRDRVEVEDAGKQRGGLHELTS